MNPARKSPNLWTIRFPPPRTPLAMTPSPLRTLALLATLSLSVSACAQSQPTRDGGDRAEQRLDELRQTLDLTDAQTAELRAVFQAQAADRPARGERRSGGPADRDARRAQMQQRRAETERQIEAILTPAQMERYRAWRASQPQRGGRGRRGDTN